MSARPKKEMKAEDSPLFAGMAAADCVHVSAAARVKEFTNYEMLYMEDDPVQQVLLLTSGIVKVAKVGQSGAEVIVALAVPGDVLGAAGLFSTGRHATTAQVFRPCRAMVWEASLFIHTVDRFPILRQNIVRILDVYSRDLEQRFQEMATERVAPRVARQLLRLATRIGQPAEAGTEVSISREELAQMTGTTLFTVSRLLSTWESKAIVLARRKAVIVCNVQALTSLSEQI